MTTQTIVKKVLPFEIREIAPRTLEFTGSTQHQDRMGDIIEASGWQFSDYKRNPVFLWAHQYDMPPVGKAVKVWKEEDRLKFHIQFPLKDEYEFADTIYKLYKGGYLRATSVGFIPIDSEPIETKEGDGSGSFSPPPTHYIKQELLELSGCPVPANPNALAEAKANGLITMKQLDILCKEHDCIFEPTTEDDMESPEENLRSSISYQAAHPNGTPVAPEDEEWDAGQEVAAAEVDDLKIMCAIVQGDTDLKTSYKLPHHEAAGNHRTVWKGVAAAGAVLMGARGGIDATEAEKAGAKKHLAKHYKDFDKTPPWEAERHISQRQIADDIAYLLTAINQEGLNQDNIKLSWPLIDEIMRISGGDIPVEIAEKIGAVLNKANRDRLEKIQRLAQEVIDSAEPSEPEKEAGLETDEIAEIVRQSISRVIQEARGKIIRK